MTVPPLYQKYIKELKTLQLKKKEKKHGYVYI